VDLQLKDATAIVIGAAQGIGRAIAEAFAAEGARVAMIDLSPAVHAAAAEISALAQALDATDYDAMQRGRNEIEERLGPCDHLVYAAGLGSGKFGNPFWKLEPSDWDRVLKVNMLGAVNAAHAFGQGMAERKRGTMLFISSVAGQIGSQTDPPYSAAKAALINFTQCAAKDLAPYGVRVNAISPGMVKTAINRSVWQSWWNQQPEDARMSYEAWAEEKIRKIAPLGRWQEPEEIAAMAVFLASPQARNITGQTLNVDGGQVMHS
jgi:NAD(P)-dependent dehydrogenase (short-subunit alcohol dehydrogenase family)